MPENNVLAINVHTLIFYDEYFSWKCTGSALHLDFMVEVLVSGCESVISSLPHRVALPRNHLKLSSFLGWWQFWTLKIQLWKQNKSLNLLNVMELLASRWQSKCRYFGLLLNISFVPHWIFYLWLYIFIHDNLQESSFCMKLLEHWWARVCVSPSQAFLCAKRSSTCADGSAWKVTCTTRLMWGGSRK